MKMTINYDLLNEFLIKNNMLIIDDKLLQEENIYKDLKYATKDNFLKKEVYPKDMPLIMNIDIWKKLIVANNKLKEKKLCIKILDSYRPINIQKIFFEYYKNKYNKVDEGLIADPNKYGLHNIKMNAIDIFPVKLDGSEINMPSNFDDFTGKASIYYNDCSGVEKNNRDNFIKIMEESGFIVNKDEFWHFYDNSLEKFGMNYDYSKTKYVPKLEDKVFTIID